jgi:mono/diheme cytochrome c family protein
MIKLTNTFLIGLIATGLLVGCGSSDSDNEANEGGEGTEVIDDGGSQPVEPDNGTGGGTETPTTPPPATPTASTFGSNVMPVLVAKCQSCHGSNGNFTVTTASSTYANITALKGSAAAGGQYLLDKGSNTAGHGGGMVIATSSAEYATIKSWVDAGAANN